MRQRRTKARHPIRGALRRRGPVSARYPWPGIAHRAGRDTAALTDRQAMLFRRDPDITRTLPTGRGPPVAAGSLSARPLRVLGIGREQRAEQGGVLDAQIDLISVPSTANRTVSSVGPPVKSSSNATVTFCVISAALLHGACTVSTQCPAPSRLRTVLRLVVLRRSRAQHHITAHKQRHQPTGHAIYRAPPPLAAQTAQNQPS
jgi:hypothetical protein